MSKLTTVVVKTANGDRPVLIGVVENGVWLYRAYDRLFGNEETIAHLYAARAYLNVFEVTPEGETFLESFRLKSGELPLEGVVPNIVSEFLAAVS